MAIDVEIQDENGACIARYDGPPLRHQFTALAPPESACFRFILPWADATFNEEQIKVLKDEIRSAASDCPPARLGELQALSSFLEGASGAHTYVKFIGD